VKSNDIPEEIINEYKLQEIANKQGMVCIEVTKGMYGLPQAGLLANELLEQHLNKHRYFQSKLVPELWKHTTRPILFTLVVDDFGVKYVGKEHAEHLVTVLQEHYQLKADWTRTRYRDTHGMGLRKRSGPLIHGGICATSTQALSTHTNEEANNQPFPHTAIKYGAKIQYAKQDSTAPPVNPTEKKFIQKVCRKFLFYGRAVNSTVLTPISAIASQSANPTKETLAHTNQLLDYLATQEDAVLTYNRSEMVMVVHSDASYLCEPKAKSRAGGHFFMSANAEIPPTTTPS